MTTIEIRTSGTHCPSCAMLVEMAVGDVPGVQEVAASHPDSLATVTYDPATTGPEAILTAIREAGYGAEVSPDPGATRTS
jgi:copper chaperone CopZ